MSFIAAFEWMKIGYTVKHQDRKDEWRLKKNRIEIVDNDGSVKYMDDFNDDVTLINQILSDKWELCLDKSVKTWTN